MTIWATLSVLTASMALGLILISMDAARSYAPHSKDAIKALVAYQFIGISLLLLGTISLYQSLSQSIVLQSSSLILRLGITLSSTSFLQIVSSMSKLKRFSFYFFNAISIVFIAHIYFHSMQTTLTLGIVVLLSSAALSFLKVTPRSGRVVPFSHGNIFVTLEGVLKNLSQVCDRLIGPIIVEWLVMSVIAFLWTSLRILSRFFAYASLQRYFATSLLLLLLLLLFVLRP